MIGTVEDWLGRVFVSPRAAVATTLVCAVLAAAWIVHVAHARIITAHAIPDYGDTFRLIEEFLIPWDAASGRDRLALLLHEYKSTGHGHVLTRLAMLGAASREPVSFSPLGTIGFAAYLTLLGWIALTGSKPIDDPRQRRLVGAILLAAFVRPDEIHSLLNNHLAFEYVFLLAGLVYLWLATRNALADRVSPALAGFGIGVVLLGDTPGLLGIIGAILVTAVYASLRCCRPSVVLWSGAPLAAALAIDLVNRVCLGASPSGSLSLEFLRDLRAAFAWTTRGIGETVVYIRPEMSATLGLSEDLVLAGYSVLGLTLLVFSIVALLHLARSPHESDALVVTLLVYGLLACGTSYVTRSGDPMRVFSPRYVRHFQLIPVGLLILALVRGSPRRSIAVALKRILLGFVVCVVVVCRVPVSSTRAKASARSLESNARLLAEYSPEMTSEDLVRYHRLLHFRARRREESARAVLAWVRARVLLDEPHERDARGRESTVRVD